jgi:hypothetical protein
LHSRITQHDDLIFISNISWFSYLNLRHLVHQGRRWLPELDGTAANSQQFFYMKEINIFSECIFFVQLRAGTFRDWYFVILLWF